MMIEEEAEKRKNEVQDNKRTENEKERKEKEKNNNVIQVNNEEEKNMNKSLLNGVQKEEKGKEEEKKVEEKKKEEKKEEKNASEEKDDEKEKKKKEIKEEEKKEQEKKEKKEKKEDEHIDKSAECTLGGDLCLNNIADTATRFYEKLTEEKKEEKKEEEKKKEEKEKKNINVSSPSPPSPPPQDDSQNNENDNLKKKEEEQENDSCVAQSSSSTASSSSPSPLCPSSSSSSLSFQKEEKKDVYSSSFLAARKPSASVISPPSSSSSSSFSCASRIPPPLLELEPSIEMIDTYGKFIKKAEEMHKEIGVHTAKDINGEYKMLRFLIGYNFDLTAACDAYKKHLNWRKKNNINAKMRKYVKHKMIKNLMPELAPNHQNVILHFPANLLLRNMDGNEEEKEEEKEKEEEEKEEKKEEKEKEKEEMEENNNPSNSFEEQEKKEKLIGKKKEEKNDNNKNNNNNNNISTNEKKNILSKLLHRNKNNEEKEKKEVLKKKEEKKKEEKEKEEKKEEKEEEKEEEEDICALLTDELKSKIIRDNEGNITSIERLGLIDEKRLSASLSGEEFLLWQHFQWEFRSILLDILSRESGRLVKATLINDLSGLSARCLNKHTILMLRESISSASENYPECVHRIIFINSPKVFTAVWTTVKSWLTPRTISKVVLLDSDYEASLFKYFDRKSLPLFLGGENSAKYASVPQSGLLCNDRFGLGEEHSTLTINARKKEQISYTVSEGVNVYWSWGVTDHDVGFSVKFRPNSVSAGGGGALSLLSASRAPKEITLVEFKKYDCNSTHRGVCLSPGEGVMTFTWDNSWGLLTQRTIKYKLEVVPPDERMSTQTAPSSPNAGGGGGGGGGGEVTQPQMT